MPFLHQLRFAEWLVLTATIGVMVWSWMAYVVNQPQDFHAWGYVFLIATTVGGTIQTILFAYVRPGGTLRARLAFGSTGGTGSGFWIVIGAPTVVTCIALLLLTPPSTPVTEFDPDFNRFQVIFLVSFIALAFTLLGAAGLFALIVLPIGFAVAAMMPDIEPSPERRYTGELTRSQLVVGALLFPSMLGFGISMARVTDSAAHGRARMSDQLHGFLTLDGNGFAIVSAWFFIAVLTVLCIVNNRMQARRRHRRRIGV